MICPECNGTLIIGGTCGHCSGSGEGMADRTTCLICKGSGGLVYDCDYCGVDGRVVCQCCGEDVDDLEQSPRGLFCAPCLAEMKAEEAAQHVAARQDL